MASLLPFYLALVIWNFGSTFAFADSFLDSDDSLWNADVVSSCSPGSIEQPSKLRARDLICLPEPLAPSTTQLKAPDIPDLTEIENALTKTPLKQAPDRNSIKIIYLNGITMATNDPNYYCARYAEESRSIPVCGSGNGRDRTPKTPPYYSKIENSRLRESICLNMLFKTSP